MRNVKHIAAWHVSVAASLVLLACVLPQQLKAADLSGNANLQFELSNGVLARRQLELTRMQRDEDGQQGTTKPAPKPEQRTMPPARPQKQQPHRNIRSGMRIPEHQFRSRFGRQHTFQIQQLNGNRFQAGGFLFEVVDVWPAVFSFEDPFFIDEIDEQFFLFDVNQPGVRTLVVIVQEL